MSVGFRKTPARVEITDQSAAIAEATQRGLVKTSPDMSAYRKHAEAHFEKTGEVLPGMEFKPSEEKFSIRQSKAKEPKEGGETPETP